VRVVYVCSPWRAADEAGRNANLDRALQVCREIALAGDVPVAPHLLFTRFLSDDVPAERDRGIACGLVLMARCDEVRAYGDTSEGMRREIQAAKEMGIFARRLP
jgi:hypothetical protein